MTTVIAVSILVSGIVAIERVGQGRNIRKAAASAASTVGVTEVQTQIDAFTRSIVNRDVTLLAKIVSKEVIARNADRGLALSDFLEKQRMAIAKTFDLNDRERPAFKVTAIVSEGDAVRATLTFHGQEINKPFYFVREGGGLKLNFARPGFSKAVPAGALLAKDKYTITNQNIPGNQPFAIRCYEGQKVPDATVIVPASSTKTVNCENACGWFSGSIFAAAAPGSQQKKCDWNWWGADVYINLLDQGGWRCNDSC